jgi:transposase
MDTITYVGLDVHKATISVAVAENGRNGEVRQVGVIENRDQMRLKLAKRLSESFCYEAGPCGYGVHRLLSGCGHDCVVVAPSLIPTKAGDRVKTDRRDARMLAKLHRAGELTPIQHRATHSSKTTKSKVFPQTASAFWACTGRGPLPCDKASARTRRC